VSGGDLTGILASLTDEAIRLRMEVTLPGPHAPGDELLACLLDVRVRLDRLEEILGNTLRLRSGAVRRTTALRIQLDDAWDEAAVRQRQSTVRDEYSSAKERAAATNLEVLDLRRAERTADADARSCDEAVEQIRLRYRGLSDLRQDIHTIVKARQFESTLDR
jgi:hypothetical protein